MRLPKKTHRIAGVPINKTALISLGRGVKDSLLNDKVGKEERNRRLSICHSCEYFNAPRCTLCGCFMNYKSTLISSQCPAGKWLIPARELAIHHSGETETDEECDE